MAAGLGFKNFSTGDVLTAADVNGYLMQGVWVFANATARNAAVTSPVEGNVCYLSDTNDLQIYSGTAWVSYGAGDITGVTAGTGISGGGASGDVTVTNSMATAIDAKGDLVVGTADNTFSRLAVGSNDQVLTADSATSTGLKWATVSGGDLVRITTQTFSGSSAVNVNNVFSSTYDNYLITLNGVTAAAGSPIINMRLRLSGTDDTGNNYDRQYIAAGGTSLSAARLNASSFEAVSRSSTTDTNYGEIRIFNPARAVVTQINAQDAEGSYGASQGIFVGTFSHRLATAYDGFTIFPATSTISGTVRVYGYKNS